MIVDCHCHAGPGDGFSGPFDTRAPLAAYQRRARRAGIDRTVIFPAFHSDYRIANRAVAAIVAGRPDRYYGFAFVHAERNRGRVEQIVREAVEEYGFRGLKVHRYDARLSREICEVARDFALPVLYDVMGDVATVELFAREFREVNFIIPHLGSFADDWKAQQAMIDPLERHANVFTDTSGVRRFDLLADAVRRAGPGKVLFGSDGPWLHPGVEISKVHALGLDARAKARILGGNVLRLMGLATAGGRRAERAGAFLDAI